MRARRKQKGYTLLDLVTVSGIVSILAAAVIPNYVTLRTDGQQAAAQSVAGTIGSASAHNFVLRTAGKAGVSIANCTDGSKLLTSGEAIAGFSITPLAIEPGESAACTIQHGAPGSGNTATFILHGVS